jgi:hypothetical protein
MPSSVMHRTGPCGVVIKLELPGPIEGVIYYVGAPPSSSCRAAGCPRFLVFD